jgi:hypothetical protein
MPVVAGVVLNEHSFVIAAKHTSQSTRKTTRTIGTIGTLEH